MHEFKKAKSQAAFSMVRQAHDHEFKKAKSSGYMKVGHRPTAEEFQEGLDIQKRVASAPVLTPAITPIKPALYRKVDHVHNLER